MHDAASLLAQARRYRPWSEALYPALAGDAFYATLEARVADAARARAAMLAYYDLSALEAATHGIVIAPEVAPIGLSIWSLPLPPERAAQKARDKEAAIRAAMGDACLQAYRDINAFMAGASAPLTTPDDWYLSILAVTPGGQGRGRGASLVDPVLRRADDAGAATYLETFTPRNVTFYERLGFRTVGRFSEPTTGADYQIMRRPPGAGPPAR